MAPDPVFKDGTLSKDILRHWMRRYTQGRISHICRLTSERKRLRVVGELPTQ